MRVISFNANGIRSSERKGFFDWLKNQKADVLCVQELKAHAHQLSEAMQHPAGIQGHFHFARRPGYSGVALYTRKQPNHVHIGLSDLDGDQWADMDAEGRFVQADFDQLSIISVYLPSGSSSEERQAIKYIFLERFLPYLRKMKASGREIMICGDINIAHRRIDLKNWQGNRKNSGFLSEERAWMDRLLSSGFIDTYRSLYPDRETYTWWSNRGRARENNVGWRIDYTICTPDLAASADDAFVYTGERFSDHAPLITDFDFIL